MKTIRHLAVALSLRRLHAWPDVLLLRLRINWRRCSAIIDYPVHYLTPALTESGATSLSIPFGIFIIFHLLVSNDLEKLVSVAVDVLNHVVISKALWVDENKVDLVFQVFASVEHIQKRVRRYWFPPKAIPKEDCISEIGGIVV
jgi:hypothetical protein